MEYNNPKITSFRDLVIWKKGLEIAKEIYKVDLKNLPKMIEDEQKMLSAIIKKLKINT